MTPCQLSSGPVWTDFGILVAIFRTVDEVVMFMIPDVRLRLLNMDSGKKYNKMEMDVNKRSDLTLISIL